MTENELEAAGAHTPTDDEREALATILGEPVRGTLALADRILAAGFRRSEVPEPKLCTSAYCSPRDDQHVSSCPNRVEPQGEPSAAALLAQGFSEGVNFIDDQPGPWGAGMVAGRAEAARRRAAAAVTEQGEDR